MSASASCPSLSRASSLSSVASSSVVASDHLWPSLAVLSTVAILLQLLVTPPLPVLLKGLLAMPLTVFLYQWYRIHGHRLGSETKFAFHEPNILATTQKFEFDEGPMLGDDVTPGGTRQPVDCCGKGRPRESLLAELTRDEERELMQKVRDHTFRCLREALRRRVHDTAAPRSRTQEAEGEKELNGLFKFHGNHRNKLESDDSRERARRVFTKDERVERRNRGDEARVGPWLRYLRDIEERVPRERSFGRGDSRRVARPGSAASTASTAASTAAAATTSATRAARPTGATGSAVACGAAHGEHECRGDFAASGAVGGVLRGEEAVRRQGLAVAAGEGQRPLVGLVADGGGVGARPHLVRVAEDEERRDGEDPRDVLGRRRRPALDPLAVEPRLRFWNKGYGR
uniref:PHM7_ext domain-containing protein n=1 Tax=Steinernema glaseri TaxID=37863 RepID=A0A1I7ZW61_9BILA